MDFFADLKQQQAVAMKELIKKCTEKFSFDPQTAPTKMRSHILGDKACKISEEKIKEISVAFDNKENKKNQYVFSGKAGETIYFFKKKRGVTSQELLTNPLLDVIITSDSPAYRVRKAAKIERWIQENKYENDIIVPKKYLLWSEEDGEWYSVAEAIDLDDEAIVSISDQDRDAIELEFQQINEGQVLKKKDKTGKEKDLTVRQAHALATLAFETGYTDQSYNNFFFDKQGRVAIIDTESVERGIKKIGKSINFLTKISDFLFNDWGNRSVRAGLLGTAKMKMFCKDAEAKQAVESVEIRYTLWALVKTIGKIALTILAIKAIPVVLTLAAVPTVCVVAFKIVSIIARLKIVAYLWHAGATMYIFYQGRRGYAGLEQIQVCVQKQIPLL